MVSLSSVNEKKYIKHMQYMTHRFLVENQMPLVFLSVKLTSLFWPSSTSSSSESSSAKTPKFLPKKKKNCMCDDPYKVIHLLTEH